MSTFPALVEHLRRTATVTIITRRGSGAEVATPIWVAVVDGAAYVRSAYGDGAAWNRRARATPQGAFTLVDGSSAERDPVAALAEPREPVAFHHVPADDPVQAAVDAAFRDKYGPSPHVEPLLTDVARALTLRVDPA